MYNHYMHQRTWLSIITLPIVTAFTCPVVFKAGRNVSRVEFWKGNRNSVVVAPKIQEVLKLISNNYVDKLDTEKVINGGIEYTLREIHPMNSYLTAEDLKLSDPGMAGVGITVIKKQMDAYVISVVPGSPASRHGIVAGDSIRKLNNDSVYKMSAWALDRNLRGRVGSDLTLLVLSRTLNKKELKKITLRRELIKAPPITVREGLYASIVTISDFNYGRTLELRAILEKLNHDLPLILDIRYCAGGLLSEAASMAGMFIPSGPLATVQEAGKAPVLLSVVNAGAGTRPFAKVAVLQGKYTIGAAETFSSALKRQFISIFGDGTYGLGVECTRFLLTQGKGAVVVVNKWWLGANGEPLGFGARKRDDRKFLIFKNDADAPTQSSSNIGVLPNYFIETVNSEDGWLFSILDILESKRKRKCNVASLSTTISNTCGH